ncbi:MULTISPECIES: TetR/AcrR family transcriptional regulator [Limnobacter]|uniref:TetR family transcriptional regulator n=1 Tax=Limnobacter litoralis TaxID=481366 RepID=A0ABQ5YPG3_9BURK|nr:MULTISPECIES: TetR/AcrR family transcriptional regulator [Limnobacter]GLR25327.1 TetR family transcriptional regulator [Limnobacter litoralis]
MNVKSTEPDVKEKGRRYRGVSNETRKAERRLKLIQAGIKIFGRDGYHAATVKGLCQEAGLTERYFYESFANAEALFTACYLHITEAIKVELQSVLQTTDEEDLERAAVRGLTVFFSHFKARPEAARILLVEVLTVNKRLEELSLRTLYSFVDMLETLAKPLIAQHNRDDRLDSALLASGLVGSVLYMAARWSLEGSRKPVEHVVDNAMLIFRGVAVSLALPTNPA